MIFVNLLSADADDLAVFLSTKTHGDSPLLFQAGTRVTNLVLLLIIVTYYD